MYDMICNKNLIMENFLENKNLLIKPIMISFQQLELIIDGSLNILLEKETKKLNNHFKSCIVY